MQHQSIYNFPKNKCKEYHNELNISKRGGETSRPLIPVWLKWLSCVGAWSIDHENHRTCCNQLRRSEIGRRRSKKRRSFGEFRREMQRIINIMKWKNTFRVERKSKRTTIDTYLNDWPISTPVGIRRRSRQSARKTSVKWGESEEIKRNAIAKSTVVTKKQLRSFDVRMLSDLRFDHRSNLVKRSSRWFSSPQWGKSIDEDLQTMIQIDVFFPDRLLGDFYFVEVFVKTKQNERKS